jgi:Flp pilus assembly protein TadD
VNMTAAVTQQRGRELFSEGRYAEAALQFEESLRRSENSEIWNDWAAARAAAGLVEDATRGFETALPLGTPIMRLREIGDRCGTAPLS